jgi:hypothetical protein
MIVFSQASLFNLLKYLRVRQEPPRADRLLALPANTRLSKRLAKYKLSSLIFPMQGTLIEREGSVKLTS